MGVRLALGAYVESGRSHSAGIGQLVESPGLEPGCLPVRIRLPALLGTVGQLVESPGSEPGCWEFESPPCHYKPT